MNSRLLLFMGPIRSQLGNPVSSQARSDAMRPATHLA